ncbi:MAG: hypothetical protein QNJ68_20395 [Microcoleaceae cyanobacterium MO_207.B10]|nr:hypothetical protein [Microcoleaceae cyanobacterium MO_207.B10]
MILVLFVGWVSCVNPTFFCGGDRPNVPSIWEIKNLSIAKLLVIDILPGVCWVYPADKLH